MRNKGIRRILIGMLILFCVWSKGMPVQAETTQTTDYHIYDYQELLSEEERTELGLKIQEIEAKCGFSILLVTNDYTIEASSAMAYADDFLDNTGFYDGILLFIDMENREYHISTYGKPHTLFDDEVIRKMKVPIENALAENQVYLASSGFVADVYQYGDDSIKPMDWLLYIGIAIIAGVIVCLLVIAKYKIKFSQYHYPVNDRGKINLTDSKDVFLRENVITRRIESKSSGGTSSHTSSSGKSHGGGGGRF